MPYKDPNKWALKFNKCKKCGTTEIRHKGNGLCLHCWDKKRDKKKKRKQQKLEAGRRYGKIYKRK